MAPVLIEKAWLYERLMFESVIVMVKDKMKDMEDTTSIKISFMHYMKWRRLILPVVCGFSNRFLLFCYLFHIIVN